MKIGSVHGRFQPFHNGHLKYVLAGREHCDFLWIGITKCLPIEEAAPSPDATRELPANNPLTYFERISIIREALTDVGIASESFGFVPFPIETPSKLPYFMPTSIPCYTTICETWNEQKIKLLTGIGYEVSILYREEPKTISGFAIRQEIILGTDLWRSLVPKATARAIENLGVRERLIELTERRG